MAKYSINLFQDELIVKPAFWSLNRVVLLWLAIGFLVLLTFVLLKMQIESFENELGMINAENKQQKQKIDNFNVELSKKKNNKNLLEKLKKLKLVIENKKFIHQQLTDPNDTYRSGFSRIMEELSLFHDKNISLNQVTVEHGSIVLSGQTNKPDSVPIWLSGFKGTTFLSHHSFVNFSLHESENAQGVTLFTVSSERKNKEIKI